MTFTNTGSDLHDLTSNLNQRITLGLAGAGLFFGGVISWSILIGDEQGRVNILYLLLVYLILPITSLLISTISLVFGGGINLTRCLVSLPLWSSEQQQIWRKLRQLGFDRLWFYQSSQIVAMCFSLAGLMVFFLLLLTTDMNFIWRSTLLTAQDLAPVLLLLAKPWIFWEGAQPSVDLLMQTRDSRIAFESVAVTQYARWWQFVLAVQIFYSFLPRSLLLLGTRFVIARRLSLQSGELRSDLTEQGSHAVEQQEVLAPVVDTIANDCTLVNWGGIPDVFLEELKRQYPQKITGQLLAGPTANEAQQLTAQESVVCQLVLVKSWEPPLAELADYLQTGDGYLMPLDWKLSGSESTRKAIEPFHLEEWRRFTALQENWELLQLPEHKT